jgi:hypothetical protein
VYRAATATKTICSTMKPTNCKMNTSLKLGLPSGDTKKAKKPWAAKQIKSNTEAVITDGTK